MRGAQDEQALLAGYYPHPEAGEHVIRFFTEFLKHSKGQWAGQSFDPLDWQRHDVIMPLFSWKHVDTGLRRFRKGGIWVAKKNGKTTLGAGLELYMLVGDGEKGAEVYSAAADRDQASIVFREASSMVRQSESLSSRLKVIPTTKTITDVETGSWLKALSADVPTKEGLNILFLLFDELHAQRNRKLWDTLVYGGASRQQPLILSISTAGDNMHSIGFEQYEYAKSVAEDKFVDIHFFSYIAEATRDDDWTDPAIWHKANPSLGHTMTLEQFEIDFNEALNSPVKENIFRRYRLNQWTEQTTRWIPLHIWDECKDDISLGQFEGKGCYGGLDLSSTDDTTAFSLIFLGDDDNYYVFAWFWVPGDTLTERDRKEFTPYSQWVREGFIEATPGNRVDYNYIRVKINELSKRFTIHEIAFDPWNATQLSQELADEDGFTMVEARQGYKSYNEPSKYFESLVAQGKLSHDGNPVLRWQVSNVAVDTDPAGNIKPNKEKSGDKIDGVASTIMGLSRAMLHIDKTSIYETQGLTTV